jgi:hypothetical protein
MALVVFGGCFVALQLVSADPAMVHIEHPTDEQVVAEAWLTVEGYVEPVDASVMILVHPTGERDEGQSWWAQAAVQKGIAGAWRGTINLGSSTNGKGRHFQIIAVATSRPILARLRGLMVYEGQQVLRPPALPRSEIVSVWRSE